MHTQSSLKPPLQSGNKKTSKRTVCNRHAHAVPPFIAGCSHFTRKNTMCRAPASTPKQTPCNIRAAITRRSATTSPSHHFPQSPLPLVTTSLSHHFPQSPVLEVTTSLSLTILFVRNSEDCFPASFDYLYYLSILYIIYIKDIRYIRCVTCIRYCVYIYVCVLYIYILSSILYL